MSKTGRADGDEQAARTLLGFVTVSGDEENGLRVSLPKDTALDEGIEPGDILRVEHNPLEEEFVMRKSE